MSDCRICEYILRSEDTSSRRNQNNAVIQHDISSIDLNGNKYINRVMSHPNIVSAKCMEDHTYNVEHDGLDLCMSYRAWTHSVAHQS
jgi:hypothetical protein